jgi:hypothetical protein
MGNSNEIALLITTVEVVVAVIFLMIVVDHLAKIRTALDKIADRTAKADDLIIENLEAIVWQASEIKNRIHSIDERMSQFSQNHNDQFIGEIKDILDENLMPMHKPND